MPGISKTGGLVTLVEVRLFCIIILKNKLYPTLALGIIMQKHLATPCGPPSRHQPRTRPDDLMKDASWIYLLEVCEYRIGNPENQPPPPSTAPHGHSTTAQLLDASALPDNTSIILSLRYIELKIYLGTKFYFPFTKCSITQQRQK